MGSEVDGWTVFDECLTSQGQAGEYSSGHSNQRVFSGRRPTPSKCVFLKNIKYTLIVRILTLKNFSTFELFDFPGEFFHVMLLVKRMGQGAENV